MPGSVTFVSIAAEAPGPPSPAAQVRGLADPGSQVGRAGSQASGNLGHSLFWAPETVVWLCLLTGLPEATGPPCSSSWADSCGLGPFGPRARRRGAPFPSAQCMGGVQRSQGPGWWSPPLSRPSGLQHNRIWALGADTFRQLSSLRTL